MRETFLTITLKLKVKIINVGQYEGNNKTNNYFKQNLTLNKKLLTQETTQL